MFTCIINISCWLISGPRSEECQIKLMNAKCLNTTLLIVEHPSSKFIEYTTQLCRTIYQPTICVDDDYIVIMVHLNPKLPCLEGHLP